MMRYTATFSDGFTSKPRRKLTYTHAWRATGKLRSGKPWEMHGFSTIGADGAFKSLHADTRHLRGTGATFEFSEVVPVTAKTMVPA